MNDTRLMLAAEVARTYIELRTWQQRLVLAGASARQLEQQTQLTRIASQAGESSGQDQHQAELNLSAFLATVPDLETGVRESLTSLATLTGQRLEQVQAQVGPAAPLMAVPPAPAAGLPSDLLNRRPDLRGAERDLQAANADVGVALAERYPRFSLVGNAGWNSIQSGTLLQDASRFWSLGPQFTLPLFNQGLLKSQVRANQAAYDAALATYHKAVLSALADVDVAFTRLAQDERKRQRLLEAEARQQRILDLAQRQFQAGDIARTALLQAERSLLNQRDLSLQAQSQSLVALVSVYKSLGGGWDE
jgi:NodT family efflux transporter outer membrane factor (OMF) lipoprotein